MKILDVIPEPSVISSEPSSGGETAGDLPLFLGIGIGVVCLLVAAAILVLILKGRKKQ